MTDNHFNQCALDMATRAAQLPPQEQVPAAAIVLDIMCHFALENATLHSTLQQERARLLEAIGKSLTWIAEWTPITPDDINQNPDLAHLFDAIDNARGDEHS